VNKFFVPAAVLATALLIVLITLNPIVSILFFALVFILILIVQIIKSESPMYAYVICLIPAIVLSPIISIPALPFDLRLDDFWLAAGSLIFLIVISVKKNKVTIKFPQYAKIFLLFIFWIVISLLISAIKNPQVASLRDFVEVYKFLKVFVYLVIIGNLKLNDKKAKKLVNVILISLSLSALFGLMQYLNLLNVNSWLTPYYIFETKVYDLETKNRIVGAFGNPNIFAISLVVGISILLAKIVERFKFKYLLLLFIFFVSLMMSLSRTGIISAAIVLLFILCYSASKSKHSVKIILASVYFLPIFIGTLLLTAPDWFFRRISGLANIGTDTSFNARLTMWKYIWNENTKDNWVLGRGARSGSLITFDNEWLEFLTSYGAVGVLILIAFLTCMYLSLKNNIPTGGLISVAGASVLIVVVLSMLSMTVFSALQLMPIIIIFLALGMNKIKTIT
jgi:hypothetical protein